MALADTNLFATDRTNPSSLTSTLNRRQQWSSANWNESTSQEPIDFSTPPPHVDWQAHAAFQSVSEIEWTENFPDNYNGANYPGDLQEDFFLTKFNNDEFLEGNLPWLDPEAQLSTSTPVRSTLPLPLIPTTDSSPGKLNRKRSEGSASVGSSHELQGLNSWRYDEENSGAKGFLSEERMYQDIEAMDNMSMWRAILEEDSSEDSTNSKEKEEERLRKLTREKSTSSSVNLALIATSHGFSLDVKKGSTSYCFPEIQQISRDEVAYEMLHTNGRDPIPRPLSLSSHPLNSQPSPLLLPLNCPQGCKCANCESMPRFDFQIPAQGLAHTKVPLIGKRTSMQRNPIIVSSPASGKPRPADMSARLAALVAASTSKSLSATKASPGVLSLPRAAVEPPKTLLSDQSYPSRSGDLSIPSDLNVREVLPSGTTAAGGGSKSRTGRVRTSAKRVAADGTVRPNPRVDQTLVGESLRMDFTKGLEQESLLRKRMIAFAEAVAMDEQERAKFLLGVLRGSANPCGDHLQRLTFYFLDALISRSKGDGAIRFNTPPSDPPEAMRKSMEEFFDFLPFIEFLTEGINCSIFDAVVGEKAVHIIDFGVWQGGQWPSFMERLAKQPGGPPKLRITAIECAGMEHPSKKGVQKLHSAVGRHLSRTAAQLGLPFEHKVVKFAVDKFDMRIFDIHEEEAVAVSCCMRLRNLYDSTVVRSNPRDMALQLIRNLRPKIVGLSEMDMDTNGFFFMARFKEAFDFYATIFESHDSSFPAGATTHHMVERNLFARDILNIVACEGLQRVIRSERLEQWQDRLLRAGFDPVPPSPHNIAHLQHILHKSAKGFNIQGRSNAVSLNWKEKSVLVASAWKPLF